MTELSTESAATTLCGLYAVTPDTPDTARLLELTEQVLAGAPVLLQYRSKVADARLRRIQARALQALCRRAGVPFIINDDLALALELDADGAHLGRDDGLPAAAREALGRDRILGLTCYADWARAAEGAEVGASYIAFGAMFPSQTKPNAPPAPFALISRARRELGLPVAAIGGITLENAAQVVDAGAHLLAVVNDVFGAADPAARARAYRLLF